MPSNLYGISTLNFLDSLLVMFFCSFGLLPTASHWSLKSWVAVRKLRTITEDMIFIVNHVVHLKGIPGSRWNQRFRLEVSSFDLLFITVGLLMRYRVFLPFQGHIILLSVHAHSAHSDFFNDFNPPFNPPNKEPSKWRNEEAFAWKSTFTSDGRYFTPL